MRTWSIQILIGTILLMSGSRGSLAASSVSSQTAVAVWDKTCLVLAEGAFAEAPLKDGEPDFTKVRLHGLVLSKKCLRFEVRK